MQRKYVKNWWYRVFGPVGPVVSSIVMVLGVALVILFVELLDSLSHSVLLLQIPSFLYGNLLVFFIVFLIISYGEYFSSVYPEHYWKVSPFFNAVTVTFLFWMFSWGLSVLQMVFPNPLVLGMTFNDLSTFGYYALIILFPLCVVAGYLFLFLKRALKR